MAINHEELLAQRDFINGLALSLLYDKNYAEDIAQQTWIAALEHPPDSDKLLSFWLAKVARNFAFKRIRSETRRREREKTAVKKNKIPTSEEIVEREEIRQLVVKSVLSLSEPYRSAILLRFYEEMPPKKIARTLEVPLETVKTRLKRGLGQLRKKLDVEFGGDRKMWCLKLALVAGLTRAGTRTTASAASAIGAKLLALNIKVKISVSLAIVLATVAVTWRLINLQDKPIEPPSKPAPLEASQPGMPFSRNGNGRLKSTEPPGAPEGSKVAAGMEGKPLGSRLYGSVTDSNKIALEADVQLRDETGAFRSCWSDKESGYSITGLAPGNWRVQCSKKGYRKFEKEIRLEDHDTFLCLDIELLQKLSLKVNLVNPEGESLLRALEKSGVFRGEITAIGAVATLQPPPGHFPPCSFRILSPFGAGEFTSALYSPRDFHDPFVGTLELNEPPPVYASVVLRHAVLATEYIPHMVDEVTLTVSEKDFMESLATVRMSVVDVETGEPVTHGSVSLNDRQGGGAGSLLEKNGTSLLENQTPGLLLLTIKAPGYETVCSYVLVKPGHDLDLGIFALNKGVSITGSIIGPDGNPILRAEHERLNCYLIFRNLDRIKFPQPLDTGRRTIPGSNGSFQITNVGRGRYLVLAQSKGLARVAKEVNTTMGPVTNVRFALQPGTEVVFKLGTEVDRYCVITVTDLSGVPLWAENLTGLKPLRLTLTPGKYFWKLHDDRGLMKTETLFVGEETIGVNVTY